MKPKLKIIIGSTRPGRAGPKIATWVDCFAREHGKFDVELIDLADLNLPVMDEPAHPRLRQYSKEHTKRWSGIVGSADAFVFVTPEYDYFPPAALINAIQYLLKEWAEKPAAIVSYGGVSGGLRGAQLLRLLLSNVNAAVTLASLPVPFFTQLIDQNGVFRPNEPIISGATAMMDELYKWCRGLQAVREGA